MKIFYIVPKERHPPLIDFIDGLEPKLRKKLFSQFLLLMIPPIPREPLVKHFTIEKYGRLYELRAKGKIMVRIIFTVQDDEHILLLSPFIKKHKRNTMQALDSSLKMLEQINNGTCSVKELSIQQIKEELE